MRAGSLVIADVGGQDAAQMALVEDHHVIQAFVRIEPITRSTQAFCQGDRGAVTTSGFDFWQGEREGISPSLLQRISNVVAQRAEQSYPDSCGG